MDGPLFFPAPLPDETIYSLFCRYHVRSCNANDSITVRQLFGGRRSMQTTVLSAFPLKNASHWIKTLHGFSIESLVQDNTAMPFFQAFSQQTNTSCHSYALDRFFMSMYSKCCTPSKKLRYCPKCAQAQWDTFGVSYWQILPQIRGYEICTIHHSPILESDISHVDLRYRFYPATIVLNHHQENQQEESTRRLKEIRKHYNKYLQLSEDINFLFRFSYPGGTLFDKVLKAYIYELLPIHHGWLERVLAHPALSQYLNQPNEKYFYTLIEEGETDRVFWEFEFLPLCLQIILCREIFGNIRTVYNL